MNQPAYSIWFILFDIQIQKINQFRKSFQIELSRKTILQGQLGHYNQ
ncbi:hypothetical protein pb186bvf_000259 [Paramecium bursaria]